VLRARCAKMSFLRTVVRMLFARSNLRRQRLRPANVKLCDRQAAATALGFEIGGHEATVGGGH
jgi:hypothetical protein